MELADVTDSKSVDGDIVWVRVPPPAPNPKGAFMVVLGFGIYLRGLEAGSTKRSGGGFVHILSSSDGEKIGIAA